MEPDKIRDQMRRGVVEKSIEILRRHGKSDKEIRAMISSDFRIDEESLSELLKKGRE